VRQIFLAGEKTQEGAALFGDVIADGALQHRIASFQRIEEKVNQQEARAAALGELDTDTMEHRFQLMEQESEVDRQLAALKEKKGLAAPEEKALGPGESKGA